MKTEGDNDTKYLKLFKFQTLFVIHALDEELACTNINMNFFTWFQ